ncbi:hypothetical protein [Pseudonocardia xishanensis]|uniref:Uncharacterized protein n=1 Tax=Pseudonocardia xishanensis TaxID=630995 RepID=A0ABP8S056_9PSEU
MAWATAGANEGSNFELTAEQLDRLQEAMVPLARTTAAVRAGLASAMVRMPPVSSEFDAVTRSMQETLKAIREQAGGMREAQSRAAEMLQVIGRSFEAAGLARQQGLVVEGGQLVLEGGQPVMEGSGQLVWEELALANGLTPTLARSAFRDAQVVARDVAAEPDPEAAIEARVAEALPSVRGLTNVEIQLLILAYVSCLVAVLGVTRDIVDDGFGGTPEPPPVMNVEVNVESPPPDEGLLRKLVDERIRELEEERQLGTSPTQDVEQQGL